MTELTSQLHCSKSVRERTLCQKNVNSFGIKLDWEPKFKKKFGHVIKRPNGKQRERPTISVPSTHGCPGCSYQGL